MSEPEDDLVILDEIRALENILAADETSKPPDVPEDLPKLHNLTNANRRVNFGSRGFGEVTPYYDQQNVNDSGKETIGNAQSALEANRKLIALLRESKQDLMAMLEKCVENKAIVEERIKERAKNAFSQKIRIGCAGMPYFKDAKHFVQPRNEDALTKTANGELQVVHLRSTLPWTPSDRNILWRAIRQEAAGAVLLKEQRDAVAEPAEPGTEDIENIPVTKRFTLPKNFKAMVGPIGAMEFDWMKIAAMDFDNKHTPEECRVMWRVFLHPDINRYRWTKEEDASMNVLSEKYNHQDWDNLAKELGTNRSGYQCFIRYNTNNQTVCVKERAWTPDEDRRLKLCIEKLKIGDYIPWGVVSKYIEDRTKMQVYYRWKYNVAPHLKKGRFTPEEDETLLKAVMEHGENFTKISATTMPHRSSVQLSQHYSTLQQRKRGLGNSWTITDDARLIKLQKKYGTDWSKIALKFPHKTRTQLRHRHVSILKSLSKGVSLYEIPRDADVTEEPTTDDHIDGKVKKIERERIETMHSKLSSETMQVDFDLVKYFTPIQPVAGRPGRKQKYYKEQELEDVTRKLYVLLRTLDADLAIPRVLDDRNLTEKDRQLLTSYQRYREAQNEYEQMQYESIKYLRVFDEDDAIRELHYTPLCPGDCNKNERVRINDTIDYEKPDVLDCQATPEMTMLTPAIIVDVVGQDTSEEFDLLAKYLITPKNEPLKTSAVRKIYVLGPDICSKALATIAAGNLADAGPVNSETPATKTSMAKKKRRINKVKVWESSISEGIIYNPDRAIDCVEPNYHTLLGLKHIMANDDDGERKFAVDQSSMSDEAKTSMELLKRRLVQLFKFPIGLSHVLRPEIYTKNLEGPGIEEIDEIEKIDEDQPNVPTESAPSSPQPPAKRRRQAKNKTKKVEKK